MIRTRAYSAKIYEVLVLFIVACSLSKALGQTETPPTGSGTAGDPHIISSLANLAWLQDVSHDSAWGDSYLQTANIDASSDSTWNSGAGFSPIGGVYPKISFTGTYDGGGHTISGIYVSLSGSVPDVGMFGICGPATIKNLGLVNVRVKGGQNTGGLVGDLSGQSNTIPALIDSCYVSGVVSGQPGVETSIGGLVGLNIGGSLVGSIVRYSYSTAVVTTGDSGGSYVGGLAGENNNAAIEYCYSTGSVTCGGAEQVGGLVGINHDSATISNCYSTGNVDGYDYVGGLVGQNAYQSSQVNSCYSTGTVNDNIRNTLGPGNGSYGGLVGDTASSTVNNSFWDETSSGQTTSAGGTGETTTAMKTESTFTGVGWNFATIWLISSNINNGYPSLSQEPDYPLAVQATDFAATADVESVTLRWKTESELNNAGFNVMKQRSGIGNWQLVGSYTGDDSLRGLGTSSTGRTYDFTDDKVISGDTYLYKIQSVSTNGTTKDLSTLSVTVDVPKTFALYQNYPNPFNPSTTIRFDLKEQSTVTLDLYNVLGQKVLEENYGTMNAGRFNEVVDMNRYSSGVYLYRIEANGIDGQKFVSIRKLALIK